MSEIEKIDWIEYLENLETNKVKVPTIKHVPIIKQFNKNSIYK